MKIVQIIDNFLPGGAQSMQVVFAQAVRELPDVLLTVVSLRDDNQETNIPSQIKATGARVVCFPAKTLYNPARFLRLINFLRHENFDVVHTHLPSSNVLGTIAGRLAGKPVISAIRNSRDDTWGGLSVLLGKLETFTLRYLSHQVMAVGHATAAAQQHRLGNKLITPVPNALRLFSPLPSGKRNQIRTELIGNTTQPLLISTGRLVQQKGYGDLLTAFAEVHKQHPEAVLVIAGEGPLHNQLTDQINKLGLEEHVKLLGFRDDVPLLLAASDIFVSSSHWEGLSVSILEAMAAGLPVVATNVSDTPRVVVEGAGHIVPPHEPTLLADAISSLLSNASQRHAFGSAARAFIEKKHNPASWVQNILDMYRTVINHPYNN